MLPRAYGIEGLELRLGDLSGRGWRIEGIALRLGLRQTFQIGFHLSAKRLKLAGVERPLRNLRLDCPRGSFDGRQLGCESGRVRVEESLLDQPEFTLSFHWDLQRRRLTTQIKELMLASGTLHIDLAAEASGWDLELEGKAIDVERLRKLVAAQLSVPIGWTTAGRLSPRLRVHGDDRGGLEGSGKLAYRGVEVSGPAGDYQAEGLEGVAEGRLHQRDGVWRGKLSLQLAGGEILTPAFYLAPSPKMVSIDTRLRFNPGSGKLVIEQLNYIHPDIVEASLSAMLEPAAEVPLRRLRLRSNRINLGALYRDYLQPTLAEGVLAQLEWQGEAEVELDYLDARARRLQLSLYGVAIDSIGDQGNGRPRPFALHGVDGRLLWSRDGKVEASRLSWQGGHLLEKISLGPAVLDLALGGEEIRLLRPATIPVLDGQLLVDRFSLSGAQSGSLAFDAVLTPISLELISRALDWPPLAGKLSGVIPGLTYQAGSLDVAGMLLVRVFDGDILIRRLHIEDPFGVFPVLESDLQVKNLDLEKLTNTFAFGKITGRLGGSVRGLRLEAWRPVAFDANFATPEGDRSRHRISQKAVDNISNLGGTGASGILSRSFLRIFDEFGYKRLGISCRLQHGVCEMGGVAPAGQGYYLVEGGGVPRISILGYNRSTDWDLLLDQLQAISATGSPMVE